VSAGFVSGEFYDLIIASAIISMLLTPLVMSLGFRFIHTRLMPIVPGTAPGDAEGDESGGDCGIWQNRAECGTGST